MLTRKRGRTELKTRKISTSELRRRIEYSKYFGKYRLQLNDDTYSVTERMRPPESQHVLVFVNSGTYNTIYKTPDNKLCYRITTEPFPSNKAVMKATLRETLLNIRLSCLLIAPRIFDCYFVHLNKSQAKCVLVYEYSEYGSLDSFFSDMKCTQNLSRLVKQTGYLYKKMLKNLVFCIDVKPDNMLVASGFNLRLIDFDDNFCGSKETKYSGRKILNDGIARIKKQALHKSNFEKIVKDSFCKLNLLQVALLALLYNNKNAIEFARKLVVNNIKNKDIVDMITISELNVSKNWNVLAMIRHYILEDNGKEFTINGVVINDDATTLISFGYMWCAFGFNIACDILYEDTMPLHDRLNKTQPNPSKMLQDKEKKIYYNIWDENTQQYVSSISPPLGFTPKITGQSIIDIVKKKLTQTRE